MQLCYDEIDKKKEELNELKADISKFIEDLSEFSGLVLLSTIKSNLDESNKNIDILLDELDSVEGKIIKWEAMPIEKQ